MRAEQAAQVIHANDACREIVGLQRLVTVYLERGAVLPSSIDDLISPAPEFDTRRGVEDWCKARVTRHGVIEPTSRGVPAELYLALTLEGVHGSWTTRPIGMLWQVRSRGAAIRCLLLTGARVLRREVVPTMERARTEIDVAISYPLELH